MSLKQKIKIMENVEEKRRTKKKALTSEYYLIVVTNMTIFQSAVENVKIMEH